MIGWRKIAWNYEPAWKKVAARSVNKKSKLVLGFT
jgi:hypothetical protein